MESHMTIIICNKESLQDERAWKEHAGRKGKYKAAKPGRRRRGQGVTDRRVTHQHAAYMIGTTVRTALAQGRDSHTTESLTPSPGGGGGGRPGTTPSRTAPSAPSSRTSLRSSTRLLTSVSGFRPFGRARGTCPGRRRARRTARVADTSASSI